MYVVEARKDHRIALAELLVRVDGAATGAPLSDNVAVRVFRWDAKRA
jgi:hypothetical protein